MQPKNHIGSCCSHTSQQDISIIGLMMQITGVTPPPFKYTGIFFHSESTDLGVLSLSEIGYVEIWKVLLSYQWGL